jgi:transcriptional regulator PpsR
MAQKKNSSPAVSARKPRPAAPTGVDAEIAADSQNRLLEAQATIERDYARMRELETRYQYLLQSSADPLLVVDGATRRITDANGAAAQRFQQSRDGLIGSPLGSLVDGEQAVKLTARLDTLVAGSTVEPFAIALPDGSRAVITVSLFRQNGAPLFLMRLDNAQRARQVLREDSPLAAYANGATDAIVLTDRSGIILEANGAFVELVQVATDKQVRGVSLGRWLGRTSVDLGVLITNVRQRGTLKLFATHLRAEYGSLTDVEISAAAVGEGPSACLGFTIRDVGRRLAPAGAKRNDIAKSVDQMTELVGRVPMKDIVANTAGLIEQMCIKAALELTRNNRAAAADLLGISRQSLYVKLRRYDLLDEAGQDEP